MLQILLVLLLVLGASPAAGATLPRMAEPFLSIWEDPEGRTTFADLDDTRFVPATAELLNAGYTASAIWLRLELQNSSLQKMPRFLELELASISLFDVYIPGETQSVQSGGRRRGWNPETQHRHPVVDVSLPPESRGVWYIRLENTYSLCIIAWLHDAESLAAKESQDAIVFGTYTGLMGFALVISLYVFFSTRHRSFLYFAFVLLTFHLGFQLTHFGWTWMHLWPNATIWADHANLFFVELGSIASMFFFQHSVELRRALPRVSRWIWIPVLKGMVGMGLCFWTVTPGLVSLFVLGTGVLMLTYYGIGLYLWRRGHPLAGYHSMGWLTVILVNAFSILQATDLLHFDQIWLRSALRFELMLLACALQAGFLAMAIGYQFQKAQKDREAEHEARRKLEKNLDDAHIVQEAFIPHDLKGQRFEIVTSHHPSARIGGDWLGYHHDAAHKRLILAICDVTGHGLPAALLSGAIHGAFHGLARAEEVDALKAPELLAMLMERVNDVVCMTAANTSLLATMLILTVDLETGRIDFCNAGHTPWVLVRDDHPVYILEAGSPLGLNSQPTFGAGYFQGQPGDTVFLHTDGLLDNARTARRLQLHHVCRLLTSRDPLTALQKRIEDATGPDTVTMEDDCSYLICRLEAA
ncbi:SpoIIE family protein phosphatase [Oligoflexus tunisiensis]|uniref:SpoIIE family protein phosphatase n=1 Tax=Oligoflexus tunisiensis TaxID=708132 RepID=UPI00114CCD9E|nr:SpoIIE family protein phosphatase [Oligoflexus tunisiensis]